MAGAILTDGALLLKCGSIAGRINPPLLLMSNRKTDPALALRPQHFTGHGNVDIVADVGGPETGLPVILIHGGGQTRHSWKHLAQRLIRNGCQVTNVDMRGHGDSAWAADGDYSLDAMVKDLHVIIAQQPAAPVVIGASLGGITALVASGESSQATVRGIALVDIVPKIEAAGSNAILDFMTANPEGFASPEEAAAAVATYLPHRPRPPSTAGLMKNLRRGKDGRYYWHWDPRLLAERGRGGRPELTARMERAARNICVPTLLVRGAKSGLVSMEGVRHFLELIPAADFVDVKDAAHMVAGDMNDVFSQAIIDFMKKRLRD